MAENADLNLNPDKGSRPSRRQIRPNTSQNDGTRKTDKSGFGDKNTNRNT